MWSSCKRSSRLKITWSVINKARQLNLTLSYFTQTGAAYDENTEANSNRHERIELWAVVGQKHQTFWGLRTSFPSRDIHKKPRSMHVRVPQEMAQFVLKIEKLSHIMGTAPIVELARACGLHPRLWLLLKTTSRINYHC